MDSYRLMTKIARRRTLTVNEALTLRIRSFLDFIVSSSNFWGVDGALEATGTLSGTKVQ